MGTMLSRNKLCKGQLALRARRNILSRKWSCGREKILQTPRAILILKISILYMNQTSILLKTILMHNVWSKISEFNNLIWSLSSNPFNFLWIPTWSGSWYQIMNMPCLIDRGNLSFSTTRICLTLALSSSLSRSTECRRCTNKARQMSPRLCPISIQFYQIISNSK